MTVTVRWNTFTDTAVDSFNVYRAVTGIIVDFPNSLQVGDELKFAATSTVRQTVTLTATTAEGVVADINAQALGIKAQLSDSGTRVFIRCTAKPDQARLKLYACSFLTNTSQEVRNITPRVEFELIGNVPFDVDENTYDLEDVDGNARDFYHVTAVTGVEESEPSLDVSPLPVPEEVCVVEGRVIDGQNSPVIGAEVLATVVIPPSVVNNSGLDTAPTTTVSDELGRWSLPFIRNQQVLFQIPAIGYSHVIEIPDAPALLLRDLVPISDHEFDGVSGG